MSDCYYCPDDAKEKAEYTIDCDDEDMQAGICEECLLEQIKQREGTGVCVKFGVD